MKKIITLVLAAALTTAIAGPASARLSLNGTGENGIGENGIGENGSGENGAGENGLSMQGISMQGISMQGVRSADTVRREPRAITPTIMSVRLADGRVVPIR